MPALPPVVQVFEVNAAAFMAGVDEMLAGVERLAAAIDKVAVASDRLGAASDVAATGEKTIAFSADEAAAALDKQAVAADRAGVSAEESGKKGAAFGSGLKTAFLGLAVAAGYGVVQASKFQQEVTKLYTAAGLTGASMKTVEAQILKVGDATGFTGTQIAEALYHPVSAGLDLKTALAAVSEGAKLAQIHSANLDDTMYALSSVMKAFNQNAGDAGRTAALLNSIVGQGDMRFQDFNQSVKNWAPTASSMGISIQSMGAGLAYLTDRGNSAEVAATRLTMGLSMVTAPSKAANKYLTALGLTTDVVGLKNKNLQEVMNGAGLTTNKIAADLKKPDGLYYALTDIKTAFEKSGLSASQADQVMAKIFGGGRSDKAIMSLMSNLDGVKQKYEAIGKGVSGYADSWAKTQQTVSFQWKQAQGDVKNLATSFGLLLLPAVQSALKSFTGFVQWLDKNKGAAQALAGILGGILAVALERKVAAGFHAAGHAAQDFLKVGKFITGWGQEAPGVIGRTASAFGKIGSGAWSGIKTAGSALSDASKAAGTFAVNIAKAGAQATIAGAKMAIMAVKTVAVKIAQLAVAVATRIWTAAQWLLDVALAANPISLIIIAIALLIGVIVFLALKCGWFRDFWKKVWHDIAAIFDVVRHALAASFDWLVHTAQSVLGWFGRLQGLFRGWWMSAVNAVVNVVGGMLRFIGGIPGRILSALGNLGSLLFNAGVSLVEGLINGVTSMFGAVASTAGHLVASLGHSVLQLLGIGSPSRVAHWWGQMVAQGLADGITSNSHLPANAAARMAGGVTSGLGAGSLAIGGGAGAGGAGGTVIGPIHLTVNGFVGNQQELMQALYYQFQKIVLQQDRRNVTNGLSLAHP